MANKYVSLTNQPCSTGAGRGGGGACLACTRSERVNSPSLWLPVEVAVVDSARASHNVVHAMQKFVVVSLDRALFLIVQLNDKNKFFKSH